ncbi:TPA: hypothetical protein EYP70_08220 [Candidatus Bathyarchaeota archaeon]|nr:hypothetical protein [Candidatus Bathyarchaeota archaeon]
MVSQSQEEFSRDSLLEAVKDQSVKRVANIFHYLIVHADIKQYYYELKFIRSGAKLLELIGRALRNLDVLSRDENYKKDISKLRLPSKKDEATVLKYYNDLRMDFIKALSGLVLASCPLCWGEREVEG